MLYNGPLYFTVSNVEKGEKFNKAQSSFIMSKKNYQHFLMLLTAHRLLWYFLEIRLDNKN